MISLDFMNSKRFKRSERLANFSLLFSLIVNIVLIILEILERA